MYIDKKKLYMTSSVLAPMFLLVCFITNAVTRRFVLTAVVGAALIAVFTLVKKRSALSINRRQVLWVLPTFGFLGIVILYMLGTVFGFYKVDVSLSSLTNTVLPFALIIAASELMRSRLLMQRNKTVDVLCFISFILCDIAMLYEALPFASFKIFVSFFGEIVFPCIASGVLYQYVSKRYGAFPVILFRLLITLYSVLLPIAPALPSALSAFVSILFPITAIFFIGLLYERKKQSYSRKKMRIQTAVSAIIILLMAEMMLLLSCQFRYGLLVVASESMTGAIDKGDAIIYEEYDGQAIQIGQVLVFEKSKTVYIHRVVKIENIDGQLRYTTRGDANDSDDTGFITKENIIGLTDITIKQIGQPTLWMRELFSGK